MTLTKGFSQTNLLPNGDFESAGGWTEIQHADFSGTAAGKSGCGYMIGNMASGHIESSKFDVSGHDTYDVGGWVFGELDGMRRGLNALNSVNRYGKMVSKRNSSVSG